MDHELDRMLLDLGNKTSLIFLDFMMRTVKFEELVDIGDQLLSGFYQELEIFRRPPLHKSSNVVDDIIETNHTDRMKAYVEAGCRNFHLDIQNISKLHSYEQGLQDHLIKVKGLLEELEGLAKEAIDIVQTTNQSTSHLFDVYFGDGMINQVLCYEEDEVEPVHVQGQSILLHATMMMVIYGMLRLDYTMQENIILSLNLKLSPSELESYCVMWGLRPYINDNVMRLGWRLVP